MKIKWSRYNDEEIERMKVPGGWLVRTWIRCGDSPSICFYPDPNHLWEEIK